MFGKQRRMLLSSVFWASYSEVGLRPRDGSRPAKEDLRRCLSASPRALVSPFFSLPFKSVLWCLSAYSSHAFEMSELDKGLCVCVGTCVCVCVPWVLSWTRRCSSVCVCAFLWGTLFPLVRLGVELIFVVLEVRVACQQSEVRSPGTVRMTPFSSHVHPTTHLL